LECRSARPAEERTVADAHGADIKNNAIEVHETGCQSDPHFWHLTGAGSVVTRDSPERVFAAGNPCRVIRELTE
jgi:hypothetical protein